MKRVLFAVLAFIAVGCTDLTAPAAPATLPSAFVTSVSVDSVLSTRPMPGAKSFLVGDACTTEDGRSGMTITLGDKVVCSPNPQ